MNKKLIYTIAAICLTTNIKAESFVSNLIKKFSNPGVDTTHNVSKIKFGRFYIYKSNSNGKPSTPSAATNIEQATNELLGTKTPYDPVAIKAALEWQSKDKTSDDVMNVIDSNDKALLYGPDSPLRDDAVAAAWAKAMEAEAKLKKHREYMKSVAKAKNNIAKAKENDPKTNQTSEVSE